MTLSITEENEDLSPTTAFVDEKVKELLDDDSIDEFFRSAIYARPPSVPPLMDIGAKRLSPSEEQDLISRLTKRSPPPQLGIDTSSLAGPRRFMSKKSRELTQGLESIEKRALRLAEAHQRRIEQLVQEKENEEALKMFGKPRINPTSRRLAEKSSFTERQIALEQRRRILEEEARREELQECVFHPKINPKSAAAAARRNAAGNNVNVIDRLTRDAELRQSRRLELAKQRDVEEETLQPKITPVARQVFSSREVPSVFERLYPRSSSLPPPPTSPRRTTVQPKVIPYTQFMQSTAYDDPFSSVNMSHIPRLSKNHLDLPLASPPTPPLRPLKQLDLSSIFALTRGSKS